MLLLLSLVFAAIDHKHETITPNTNSAIPERNAALLYNRCGYGFDRSTGRFVDITEQKGLRPVLFLKNSEPDYLVEGLLRFREHDKIGFANECMATVIPAQYDFATAFRDGVSLVCKGCDVKFSVPQKYQEPQGLWNLIDWEGSILYPKWMRFEQARARFQSLTDKGARACPANAANAYAVDVEGNPVDPLAATSLTGYRAADGKWLMPPQLDNQFGFWENTSFIWAPPYLVDLRGERRIIPFIFDNGADYLSEGLFRYQENNKIGYANACLETVITAQFEAPWPFDDNFAIVCEGCILNDDSEHQTVTDGYWAIIDKTGQFAVPYFEGSFDEARERLELLKNQATTPPD